MPDRMEPARINRMKFKQKIECEVEIGIPSDEFVLEANKLSVLDRWWIIQTLINGISNDDIDASVEFFGKSTTMKHIPTYLSKKAAKFLEVIVAAPDREEDKEPE